MSPYTPEQDAAIRAAIASLEERQQKVTAKAVGVIARIALPTIYKHPAVRPFVSERPRLRINRKSSYTRWTPVCTRPAPQPAPHPVSRPLPVAKVSPDRYAQMPVRGGHLWISFPAGLQNDDKEDMIEFLELTVRCLKRSIAATDEPAK